MTGGRELLLLAVIPLLVRCQQKPTVSMSPNLTQIFTGDLLHLHCKDGQSGGDATWYFNDKRQDKGKNKTLKIVATSKDSGRYRCEISGQMSDELSIKVYEYVPIASLSIRTGQPVMRKNDKVLLRLMHDNGLHGWFCKVNRGEETRTFQLRMKNRNLTSFVFETTALRVPETIYWCEQDENYRSNQVILRTTENEVTLEMYPFPAIAGEGLTLKCLVWGTDEISKSVFYKDNRMYQDVSGPTYKIRSVTESDVGRYKCEATYRHKAQTIRTSHTYDSDVQDMLFHARPVRPQLSNDMECSCPSCYGNMSYRFYEQTDRFWRPLPLNEKPSSYGIYHCRFVLDYMRTLPSNSERSSGPGPSPVLGIVMGILVALLLICFLLCFLKWNNKRKAQADIYQEVPMRSPEERHYDALNVAQVKEGEYDTLQSGAEGREKTGGEYQPLKKQGTKEEVYHTLGDNAPSGSGEGGYEALKREGMQKDEYDTLKTKEAEKKPDAESEGGDGGYEALKREGMQKDEYDTLKTKQAEDNAGAKSEGGYEALKREGMQKDEYDTLKTKEAEKKPGAES
ncbi:uncharacterized protein LOC105926701 [Fundulus heteroclitus]|uniref:uncharacterized protein LOC105926701 n=1 Tax=Fundulus heteroclitus TaxID=8078 RepID=UPI00165AAC76|nr:uncharacterized protein LOC105926701 [Fundulus heteroclitus]